MASRTAAPRKRAKKKNARVRTSAPTRGQPNAAGFASGSKAATVRHYCQGIGDCHLLKFTDDQNHDFWVLIDCGVHTGVSGGSDTIARIVRDIASTTSRIDVLVVTHEHWDHVSGFLTEAETFAELSVGEVWMAWTENPADAQARLLDKFKAQALKALQATSRSLESARGLSPHLLAVRDGLKGLLEFNFGAKGEKVRAARDAAIALAPGRVRYLEPGEAPIVLPSLTNLRVYVLGPPREAKLLGITERASEMYGLGPARGWSTAHALNCASAVRQDVPGEDYAAPFDPDLGTVLSHALDPGSAPDPKELDPHIVAFVRDRYSGPVSDHRPVGSRPHAAGPKAQDQSWRRIDMDWLGAGADLAIQLDNRTNNSSLVLAFEFVDTKRVMLFVADAQVGNWLSWQALKWKVGAGTVTGPDLLARTVYYKVGHHGSENATLKQKGLELMTSPHLSAFIPTNQQDAEKIGWGEMPFDKILDELQRRCSGRVIRADDPWIGTPSIGVGFQPPSGSVRALQHNQGLWVQVDVA
jgi:hypothetical protein